MAEDGRHCIIIGGGAAGLTAAGVAGRRGLPVTVVERNPRMARKVMITGKGRCNVTNACTVEEFIAHVPENGRFLYSALNAFSPQDTMDMLKEMEVPLKVGGWGLLRRGTGKWRTVGGLRRGGLHRRLILSADRFHRRWV